MSTQDLLLRQAPHSTEAEQAVLGSMLIDADCVKLVMEKIRQNDFYFRQNREIFETIYNMFIIGKPIDGLTVADEMKHNGTYDEKSTRTYLAQLMEITPTSANVMEYAKIVTDTALLRAISDLGLSISSLVQENTPAEEALEVVERQIHAIRNARQVSKLRLMRDILQDALQTIGERNERGGNISGVSTGFPVIDEKISGLNKSDLILLAARPGMGKTALALQIAFNFAFNDRWQNDEKPRNAVAIFSLEMSDEQLCERVLSQSAKVYASRLKSGRLDKADWGKVAEMTVTLSAANVWINDDAGITVAGISAECHRVENLGLVIVDYMQLASSGKRRVDNRQVEIAEISRALKILAKDLNVPVLCLSQLSRANEKRDDKRPQLSDLRDSGAIEQDADIVMFLYRDDYYHEDSEEPGIAECIVAKNRHGETGRVKLRWIPEYTMFSEVEDHALAEAIEGVEMLGGNG